MKLTLVNKIQELPDVISFHFQPETPFNFIPGQFLKYTLPHENPDDRGITRFYTIASAPHEEHIQVTTRFAEKSSTFKDALRKLEPGATIEAIGPNGGFTNTEPEKPAVFIAGGIGITPFRSMMMDFDNNHIMARVTMLYGSRTPDNILFKDTFDDIATRNPHFKIVHVIEMPDASWTGESGRITAEMIQKYAPDLANLIFYLSGPKPMVDIFTNMLQGLNVDKAHIKQDFFPGYGDTL
jgi:glycine betaine catabolism B